jgi:DNA-binding protein H-NS
VSVKNKDLAALSVDQLWRLRAEIERLLSSKIETEKRKLEQRLAQLEGRTEPKKRTRRPYPTVRPKYRNPERPSEIWSGRGKQPRWVRAQLASGKKLDDLLISQTH